MSLDNCPYFEWEDSARVKRTARDSGLPSAEPLARWAEPPDRRKRRLMMRADDLLPHLGDVREQRLHQVGEIRCGGAEDRFGKSRRGRESSKMPVSRGFPSYAVLLAPDCLASAHRPFSMSESVRFAPTPIVAYVAEAQNHITGSKKNLIYAPGDLS